MSGSRAARGLAARGKWLAATVLAVAATWGFARAVEPASGEAWLEVERRDLVIGAEIEGELMAVDSADLGPPQVQSVWDFKISFLAPEGSEVAEGEPVLGFDTTRLQQQQQEKLAERDSAVKELEKRTTDLAIERRDRELQLAEARADLRRAELQLAVPVQVAERRELEKARIDQGLAKMRIDHVQASLHHLEAQGRADVAALAEKRDRAAIRLAEIESQLEAMTVRAPRAGTVIYKTSRRGEKKKVGDSAWRGEKVVQIPDLSRMRGSGQVAEADAGRLAVGQPVTFRLDAYPDQEYRARVQRIHRTVQNKSWRNPQKVVRLEIELEATDTERMRPGMRFRGTVETSRIPQQLVVPPEAVFQTPEGAAVYVRTWLGRREVFPDFGERSAELIGVESGLSEGDRVLHRGGAS